MFICIQFPKSCQHHYGHWFAVSIFSSAASFACIFLECVKRCKIAYKEFEPRVIFMELCFSQKLTVIYSYALFFTGTVLSHCNFVLSSRGKENPKLLKNSSVNIIFMKTGTK